ncbi:MAG: hypothetical protein HY434_00530 [Candidatus Liptonbacteria bacterium]|nr:hypothetical protein [Candidatus Liptonbacteria bacterium]
MEFQGNQLFHRAWRVARIPVIVIALLYAGLVIYRIPAAFERKKTEEAVAKIHAQKITPKDVMGENLPPEPDPALKDATVAGIDSNGNGIRDDVELAIFKEYPNSAKTRAVLLQYALALQMEVAQLIVNEGTVTEVAIEQGRADTCVADTLVPRKSSESSRTYSDIEKIDALTNFIENKQFNTDARKKAHHDFYESRLGSYGESTNAICDVDLRTLLN